MQPVGDTDFRDAIVDIGAYEYQGARDSTNSGLDEDGNGILDSEDPDCNGNGIIDALEIAGDVFEDRDFDGVPDIVGCEADCDGNNEVDIGEIFDGDKADFNRNGIPDICEDCNGNLRADSLECAFDILLVLDNSPSERGGEFFCNVRDILQDALNKIENTTAGEGGRVRLERIYPAPLNDTDPVPPCSADYVANFGDPVPCKVSGCAQNWSWEAWSAATATAASKPISFPGQPGYWNAAHKRIIIPICDELPDGGSQNCGPCADPEIPDPLDLAAAEASIDNAVAWVSDPNSIATVFPVMGADASELVVSLARDLAGVDDPNRDGGILDLQDLQASGATEEQVANEILDFVLNTDPTCAVCCVGFLADLAIPFGVLDLADINTFVAGFTNMDPIADVAEPFGTFDLADITAFIAAFNTGCDRAPRA